VVGREECIEFFPPETRRFERVVVVSFFDHMSASAPWAALKTSVHEGSKAPKARGGHTTTLVEKNLLVQGGQQHKNAGVFEYFSCNPTVLDTETHTWFEPRVALGKGPIARAYHTTTRVGGELFLFGGSTQKNGDCITGVLGDMPVFDLVRMAWDTKDVRGRKPRARFMHSAALSDGKLFVFGGSDGKKSLSDVSVLDVATMLWSMPNCSGGLSMGLQAHSCTLAGDKLYIVGGMNVSIDEQGHSFIKYSSDVFTLNLVTMDWQRLRRRGEQPTGRAYHGAAVVGNFLVLLGGWSGQVEQVDTISTLDLDGMGTWATVTVPGQPPAGVYGHTATVIGSNILIFGGWDGVSPLATVNVLDTTKL